MLSAKRFLVSGRFPLAGVPLLRLIPWLNLLFVALLAYSLAQLTWLLIQGVAGGKAMPLPVATATSVQIKGASAAGLDSVAALHLLGSSEEPLAAGQPAPMVAPETRLNLTLRGLIALNTQREALAIIAQGGGEELAYRVGDTVPGGAVLHEIHADRVILARAGSFEALTLPKEKMVVEGLPERGGLDAGPAIEPRQVQALRETIRKNPQEAMRLIHAQPVMDGGQLKGYRVSPGRDRRLFNSVGLRPGDVVTSVNGIPLNDMSRMGALFEQLSSADRLEVTLERGGQQTRLSLGLD